jgi:hypothetical protein
MSQIYVLKSHIKVIITTRLRLCANLSQRRRGGPLAGHAKNSKIYQLVMFSSCAGVGSLRDFDAVARNCQGWFDPLVLLYAASNEARNAAHPED